MNICKVGPILLCFILFCACNKSNSPAYNDRPVVMSYLFAGKNPVVKISRQEATTSAVVASSEDLATLEVYLSDDSMPHLLYFVDTAYTDTNFIVQPGQTYSLFFMYNNKEVSAVTTVPSRPTNYAASETSIGLDKIDASTLAAGPLGFSMPDPVDITWTNDDNGYYMLVAENTTDNPELVRDTVSGNTRPAFSFRNQPSISSSTRLAALSFEYFGVYRLILYHLQPEYATLYEESNNSSQNLTTPVTNVVNGFGIFTGINADTILFTVIKN